MTPVAVCPARVCPGLSFRDYMRIVDYERVQRDGGAHDQMLAAYDTLMDSLKGTPGGFVFNAGVEAAAGAPAAAKLLQDTTDLDQPTGIDTAQDTAQA